MEGLTEIIRLRVLAVLALGPLLLERLPLPLALLLPPVALPQHRVASGMSSNNGGRTSGRPRTDSAAREFRPAGLGDPSDRRIAGSESSRPHRSCQRFYSRWQ
jgi:hypothetical protein